MAAIRRELRVRLDETDRAVANLARSMADRQRDSDRIAALEDRAAGLWSRISALEDDRGTLRQQLGRIEDRQSDRGDRLASIERMLRDKAPPAHSWLDAPLLRVVAFATLIGMLLGQAGVSPATILEWLK